jgi:hypothetical protein
MIKITHDYKVVNITMAVYSQFKDLQKIFYDLNYVSHAVFDRKKANECFVVNGHRLLSGRDSLTKKEACQTSSSAAGIFLFRQEV